MDFFLFGKDVEQYTGKKLDSFEELSNKWIDKPIYKVVLSDGNTYLLKKIVLSEEQLEIYKHIQMLDIPHFQKTHYLWKDKEFSCYILASWIEGISLSKQYWEKEHRSFEVLKIAAEHLREIHELNKIEQNVEISVEDVEHLLNKDFLTKKQKRIIKNYILSSLPLLNKRVLTVIHGDMHLGNIIETKDGVKFIDIDFARYGDSYMDLIYFANMQHHEKLQSFLFLQYYFNYHIPNDFWRVVNVYVLLKAIAIIQYEIDNKHRGKHTISIDFLLKQYKYMKQEKPKWFREYEEKAFRLEND